MRSILHDTVVTGNKQYKNNAIQAYYTPVVKHKPTINWIIQALLWSRKVNTET